MAQYRTNDGLLLQGSNAKEVVRELHRVSHTQTASDRAFMREVAERASAIGKEVRFYNADVFVNDLIAVGFLIEESN